MVRFCDVCGDSKSAYHDILGSDLCSECTPGVKKYIQKCIEARTML